MARKRARIDWDFHPKKCAKRWYDDNDRISQLPDDILVSILCLLPMEEAARTSVLSSRWINLWKHISCLDFDAESSLVKIAKEYKLYGEESRKYVKWVNRVLRSHEGATLKVFRVCFDLSRSMKNAITQWLEFALVRHVESLELDFSARAYNVGTVGDTYYAFPNKFLKPPSQRSCIDFKSLKTLSLKCVKLTREAIEFFVHNCPLLEKLVVHYTHDISKLEVCGSSLSLKHLELCYFYGLESVKISAPNLTSLTVVPTIQGLLLENVPMLVELSVNFYYYHKVKKLLPTLRDCISQMEILTLDLDAYREVESVLAAFPKLPKLKKLVIECWAEGDKSLMGLIPLIRASPCLQEFVLKLTLWDHRRSDGEVKNTIKFPHEHLKLLKFCGYYGRSSDVELVAYILDNCVALEKIVIDPCNPLFYLESKSPEDLVENQISRQYAKQQLEAQVPKHIEFVIL